MSDSQQGWRAHSYANIPTAQTTYICTLNTITLRPDSHLFTCREFDVVIDGLVPQAERQRPIHAGNRSASHLGPALGATWVTERILRGRLHAKGSLARLLLKQDEY